MVDMARSLDRIKALDSNSDAATAVEEAASIVNERPQRAEPVLKWLLNDANPKLRALPDAWAIIVRATRVLQPSVAARTLGANGFLAKVRQALEDAPDNLVVIRKALQLIVEKATISDSSSDLSEPQFRAMLSIDSGAAAAFFQTWIQSILRTSADTNYVTLAVKVWDLRKKGPSDNELFSEHCLVPVTQLLAKLNGEQPTATSEHKRKRGAERSVSPVHDLLERLVVRHVFQPARTAFFEARPKAEGLSETSMKPYGKTDLVSRLTTLAKYLEGHPKSSIPDAESALPLLLDAALRSEIVSTPKQRLRERPWVDALFGALSEPISRTLDCLILVEMVHVLQRRDASLSLETLAGTLRGRENQWNLIEAALKLDPSVFVTNPGLSDRIFESLSEHAFFGTAEAGQDDLKLTWARGIMKPLIKAYAQNRGLSDFLRRWYGQLKQHPLHLKYDWSVWTDVSIKSLLIEVYDLSDTQLSDVVGNLLRPITATLSLMDTEEVAFGLVGTPRHQQLNELDATLVVLDAVCCAMTMDESSSIAQELLEKLVALLEKLAANNISRWMERFGGTAMWSLMAHLIRLSQEDQHAKKVLSLAEGLLLGNGASTLVAAVCDRLAGNEDAQNEVGKYANVMVMKAKDGTENLTRHPKLAGLLLPETRKVLITRLFNEDFAALDAVREVALRCTHATLAKELFETACEELATSACEQRATQLLSGWPLAAMTRQQREEVLNQISTIQRELFTKGATEEKVIRRRLSFVIKLMEVPNATSLLATDVAQVWSLGFPADPEGKRLQDKGIICDESTLALLDEATRLTCSLVLATQDQERSRSYLMTVSQYAKKYMKLVSKHEKPSALETLRRIKVSLTTLEVGIDTAAYELSESRWPHRDGKLAGRYTAALMREGRALSQATQDIGQDERVRFAAILDALAAFPLTLLGGDKAEVEKYVHGLRDLVSPAIEIAQSNESSQRPVTGLTLDTFTKCYQVLCRCGTPESGLPFASVAESLLRENLRAQEHHAIITNFRDGVSRLPPDELARVLQQLMLHGSLSRHQLQLLNVVIPFVSKTTIDADPAAVLSLSRLLEHVRQARDFTTYNGNIACILTLLRDKPFLTSQNLIEETTEAALDIANRSLSASTGAVVYTDLCRITHLVFSKYRSRLQGRMPSIVLLLETLLAQLFQPQKRTLRWKSAWVPNAQHARSFSRLLTLLCNPPVKRARNELVDENRKTRANTGKYMQWVLHRYCKEILQGRLGDGIREALMPGLWAMIEVMEMDGAEGIKSLSASMNNSERAVLRGMYDDWRRFGKWDGA